MRSKAIDQSIQGISGSLLWRLCFSAALANIEQQIHITLLMGRGMQQQTAFFGHDVEYEQRINTWGNHLSSCKMKHTKAKSVAAMGFRKGDLGAVAQ